MLVNLFFFFFNVLVCSGEMMVERNVETLVPLDLSCIRRGLWLSPHSCEVQDKICEDLC